jgi:hypothetical protein
LAVRAWIDRDLIPEPPWTAKQHARSATQQSLDPVLRLRMGPEHGGLTDANVTSAARRKTPP